MKHFSSRTALTVCLIGWTAVNAEAQQHPSLSSALDIGGALQRHELNGWHGATRIAPALRIDQPSLQLSSEAILLGSQQRVTLDQSKVRMLYAPAPLGPLRLTTVTRAERASAADVSSRSMLGMEADLSLASANHGAWVGTAFENSILTDSASAVSSLRFGAWKRIGRIILSARTSSHSGRVGGRASTLHTEMISDSTWNDTLKVYNHWTYPKQSGDSGQAAIARLWSELELGAAWTSGKLLVDAATGVRSAVDRYPRALWARVFAAIQVTPRIAVVASGDNEASRLALGSPPVRTLSLGVRVASVSLLRPPRPAAIRPSAAAFSIRSAGANGYIVSLTVPNARVVELSGDFGHWTPVFLEETRPGIWEITLPLAPGTYRMNVRIDGDRWRSPPGTATVSDEFNGTVGIVVVR